MNTKYLVIAISCCFLQTALRSQAPNWSINPGSFQYSANMIAQLNVDGVLNTESNTIGIFANDQLRGVGELVPNTGGLYFLTIYSHTATGEALNFKAYLQAQNTVKTIVETFTFEAYQQWGTLQAPVQLHVWTDSDLPISIDAVTAQFAILPGTFPSLNLAPFLIQDDNDAVVWTAASSANLTAGFTGSTLVVTPNSPDWTGTQGITVTATEQTPNHYAASRTILFTRLPGYFQPHWSVIPGQAIDTMETFAPFDLDDYIQSYFGGSCLEFSYRVDEGFKAGTDVLPDWSVNPSGFLYSMSVTGQAVLTPTYSFDNPGDRLAAFTGNTLAGVASPVQVNGKNLYFLTVFANSPDSVSFRFFSAEKQRLYTLPQKLMFQHNSTTGSVETPYLLDVSPLGVVIGSDNVVNIVRRDLAWRGWLKFHFAAAECAFPLIFNDTSAAIFSVGKEFCNGLDDDGDGLIDSADPGLVDYPPNALCKNIPLLLDVQGQAVIAPAQVDNGSSDDCGSATFVSVLPNSFTCADIGANTVTLTVSDQSGSTATCQATVTVQPFITNVQVFAAPSLCGLNNGSITITATSIGGLLAYSIDGGANWSFFGVFNNLAPGNYEVAVQAFGTSGCMVSGGTAMVADIPNEQSWYKDLDDDGYSDGMTAVACSAPATGWQLASELIAISGDCDDSNASVHPGAPEICDNLDNDCNGIADTAVNTWTGDGSDIKWSNPANWDNGMVPLPCQDVVIPAGFIVRIPFGFTAVGKTLEIALGSVLRMGQLAQLDIH